MIMAGIFGILQFDYKYDINKTCNSLLVYNRQGFNHKGNYIIDSDGCFGFGRCYDDYYTDTKWPIKSDDKRYWFLIWGNIILPNGKYVNYRNFNNDFLRGFLDDKFNFLEKIDGEFVIILYDNKLKKLLIANDIFGNFALHYYISSRRIIFSTYISGIKNILDKITLNHNSILEYLGVSQNLNGKTLFDQIKRLRPATILEISSSDYFEKQYYQPDYFTVKRNIESLNFTEEFEYSVRNRVQKCDVLAALTGGFDTRATWAVIHSLKRSKSISAVTHGMPKCRDIFISDKISELLGVNHLVFSYDENFIKNLPSLWIKLIELGEGSVPLSSAHALPYWEFCSQFGKIILDGHGGALYRRQYMKYAQHLLKPGAQFVEKFFQIIQSPLLKFSLLNNNFSQEIKEICKKSLFAYFQSIDHIKNIGAKIDLFYIHQISAFKYSVAANIQQNYIGVHHPFLNPQLFKKMQGIPESFHHKNWLHQKIIDSYEPRLKFIQLDNMGLPAPYWGFRVFRYMPMLYEKFIEKSNRMFNGHFKKMSIRKFVTDYNIFLLENMDFTRQVLLENNTIFYELFKKELVEKHLNLFNAGSLYLGDEILQLLAFKLFINKFA